jgi:DNA-directed RNA polymerase subunit F
LPEKVGRKVLSIPEAAEVLQKMDLSKADQLQKRTLDYVSKFSKVSSEKAKKIRKELEQECGLTEEESAEVVNIMPKTIEELRTFTSGWRKLLPTETLEKILKILKA